MYKCLRILKRIKSEWQIPIQCKHNFENSDCLFITIIYTLELQNVKSNLLYDFKVNKIIN